MTQSLFLVLLVVSLLVAAVGNILSLVTAFQENIGLGILCFLFPIAILALYVMKWDRPAVRLACRLFLLGLLGILLSSLGLVSSLGVSLDLDPSMVDDAMEAEKTELATAPEGEALPAIVATPIPPSESPCEYEQCMNIGYAATKQKDYGTALINFRRALGHRPNDPFATKAIHNLEVAMGTVPATESTAE